jgi:hypothetical protein
VRAWHVRPGRLLALLLIIYCFVTFATMIVWAARGVYSVTGDEPHYLVMADGLLRFGSLELTRPYAEEFATGAILPTGLAPQGSSIVSPFAHVLSGPSGLFSWHGPGISFIVALPFLLTGVVGAKLVMTGLGAFVIVVAWRISRLIIEEPMPRFAAVLVVACGYPLIPGSTQIYPDLVAGLLALSGVYFLLSPRLPRCHWTLAGYGFIIAYLPWLGTKYAVTSVVLLGSMAWVTRRGGGSLSRVAALLGPAVVGGLLLAVFNIHAFGRISGPPAQGALEVSWTSFMVLGGLVFDQSQGFLMENPMLWVGLFGMGAFVIRYRWVSLVWAVVFASVWVPSAMHTGWYGLGSFVGRYSWALAVLWIVPALIGMSVISTRWRRAFWTIVSLGVVVNAGFWAWTTFFGGAAPGVSLGVDLYTQPTWTWLESYSIWYFPLQDWMPAFYDESWAYEFWPNLAWPLLAACVVLLGVRARAGAWATAFCGVLIFISGWVASPGPRVESRSFDATVETAGYLPVQLVWQMRQGPYTWSVQYSAAAPVDVVTGKWELVAVDSDSVVAAGELLGTNGALVDEPIMVPFFSLQPRAFVLRVASYGQGLLEVDELMVSHGSDPNPSGARRSQN